MVEPRRRLIVGMSGASGVIYGIRALEALHDLDVETHLVVSKAAAMTVAYETNYQLKQVKALADVVHPLDDIGASIASGSFHTLGMIIAPCSMKTVAEIATGISSNLLSRAADVVLKERKRLVLLARESPLHAGHLKNMLAVTELGGIIAPPMPAFYAQPQSLDDLVAHTVGRLLDLFDLDTGRIKRWREGDTQADAAE